MRGFWPAARLSACIVLASSTTARVRSPAGSISRLIFTTYPSKPPQVGIDSSISHDNNLYLLQMTVSDTHVISDKLLPFLVLLKGLPLKEGWHFIFVKPPRQILACPIPSSAELRDLNLYLVEVEVKSSIIEHDSKCISSSSGLVSMF